MAAFDEQEYTKDFDLNIWKRLLPILARYKAVILAMITINGLTAVIDVAIPLFQQYAIKHFIEADTLDGLPLFALAYLGAILLEAVMVVGFALFQLFPDVFLGLFEAEGEDAGNLLAIGVPALRIISFSFLIAGFCIVSGSVFQALGHGVLSLTVSVVRQLVVLLPMGWLLARLDGLHVVWWAFPLAEIFSGTLSTLFLYWVYKKEVAPMREAK